MRRREAGTGNMLRRGGRFYPRVRVDGRYRSLGPYADEAEAERILSAANARLASSEFTTSTDRTLHDWALTCLERREISGLADAKNDRSRYQCHIRPHTLSSLPLSAIEGGDIRGWLKDLERKRASDRRPSRPLSVRTRRRCLSLLSVILQMAVDEGLLKTNPARDVKPPRGRSEGEPNYLRLEEQTAFAECADIPEADKLRALFAIYTGLRQNEQWCLELRDVHLDDARPHVIVRWGSKGRLPKNGKIRQVPLLPRAVEVLKRWLELLPRYCKKNSLKLLWPTVRGCRRQKSKVYGFKQHLIAAGIRRACRWHDLRHTCASSLVSGAWGRSWRLEEVAQVLGHTSIQVTQVYAHLATSVVQEAANATPGLPSPKSDPSVIRTTLTPRRDKASRGTTEPKVARSNRAGRATL